MVNTCYNDLMDPSKLKMEDKCALAGFCCLIIAAIAFLLTEIIPRIGSNLGANLSLQFVYFIFGVTAVILGIKGINSKKYHILAFICFSPLVIMLFVLLTEML